MNKILIVGYLIISPFFTLAQVGIGTTNPDASSALEIVSNNAGVLVPRMTVSERDLITNPALGLLIFQTNDSPGFYYFNSANIWVPINNGSSNWVLDTNDLYNGNSGNVGIGTNMPTKKLHVENVGATVQILNQDFESSLAPLTTGGSANWILQSGTVNSGMNAASSGNIGNNEISYMEYNLIVPADGATLSYFQSVSSEQDYDFLRFYIDGVQQSEISGAVPFQQANYNFVAGNYVLRWAYEKDASDNDANDAGYVDDILINGLPPAALRIVDGNQADGKVLMSDAAGNAVWRNLTSGSIPNFPNLATFQGMVIPICDTSVIGDTGSFNISINGVATTVSYQIIERVTTLNSTTTTAAGATVLTAPYGPERLTIRYDFNPQLPFDPQGLIFTGNNNLGLPDTFNLNYSLKSQNSITVSVTRTDLLGNEAANCWAGQFYFDVMIMD